MAVINDVVRVFVSSKQKEFAEERTGIREIVSRLPLLAVDAAEDWVPGRASVEDTYLSRVRAAPIYVGLFGGVYSPATACEYRAAIENPYREVLTYVKRSESVDPELAALTREFDDPREGHTTRHFDTWSELQPHFERHLWSAVQRMVSKYIELAAPPPAARGESSVMVTRWRHQQQSLREIGLPGADSREQAAKWAAALKDWLHGRPAP
jgi:hypothetical protein